MKYILMMNTMKLSDPAFPGWSKQDFRAHVAFMKRLDEDLRKSGELVSAEGLSFPDQAKRVRARNDGEPITDGVFPESKEFLAGYWIVDVDTAEQAYAIAARISAAPGGAGRPLNMPIEVRPVMCAPPDQFV